MNNLLRTLTANQVRSSLPESELKLLLSAVKETRRSSNDPTKLADAFYDSLEGLLHDLRMVTMDNRDAEAFLKPVSKTEVPDYYEIITTPMDLQTMLKKVKQRHYKSKKEFKDDLDLIWSNCFTYNATEDHPLRLCASRLKMKAERLLKNITDYKERADPVIPGEVPVRGVTPRLNGITMNGTGRHLPGSSFRSPSPNKPAAPLPGQSRKIQRDTTFPESSAFVRSQAGMSNFLQLEKAIDDYLLHEDESGRSDHVVQHLKGRLLQYAIPTEDESDGSLSVDVSLSTIDGDTGAKRKLNGLPDDRPRKRARMQSPVDKDVVELWWDVMRSEEMIANGLPTIVRSSSEDVSAPAPPNSISDPPRESTRRRKKKKQAGSSNTMLYHMNNNIRTLRRVRTVHAKFSALNQSLEEGGGVAQPPVQDIPEELDDVIDERPWKPVGCGIDMGEDNANDCLHWMGSKVLEHVGFQGTSKMALDVLSSVTAEYFLNVGRTIRFLCDKYGAQMTAEEIILHTLFESGVTQISDLERYIKDDVVRHGGRLAELEKKLGNAYREATTEEAWDDEALFRIDGDEEEGEFVMGNFAESFGEDFFGLKELGIADECGLASLTVPKRLLRGKGKGGLKEGSSAVKPTEPPPPFPPPPPFVALDSNNVDDQIGLLKVFYQSRIAELSASVTSAPAAPPVLGAPGLFPPPPSIMLANSSLASLPPTSVIQDPLSSPPGAPDVPQVIILPDDAASLAHTKIGPLGTVNKAAPAASTAKKKGKGKPVAPPPAIGPSSGAGPPGLADGDAPPATPAPAPPPPLMSVSSIGGETKKGKGAGSPSKKKKVDPFPPVVTASA